MEKLAGSKKRTSGIDVQPENILHTSHQVYIDRKLSALLEDYSINKKPIKVNFRELVYWVPYSESLTHYIHSYPAKLIKHIPIFFINSSILLPEKNSLILDPFCGTGTVLLESIIGGHNSLGCDANPLARLISSVKTQPICLNSLEEEFEKVLNKARRFRKGANLRVVNPDLWFPKKTQYELSKIIRAINEIENESVLNFLKVTFSNIIKKVSYSDPRLSVPVRLNANKYEKDDNEKIISEINKIQNIDVYKVFKHQYKENFKRMKKLISSGACNKANVISEDARKITKKLYDKELLPNQSVDLILTSPPYAGAQKYIRSSSLSLGWLGFCEEKTLRDFEKENIGREHYSKKEYKELKLLDNKEIDNVLNEIKKINPLRAHISSNYLHEMREAIKECYRVLKRDGYFVMIIGNNEVCKMPFETRKYLQIIAEKVGFTTKLILLDSIHSRGLMTKRNKTANIINSEWILVLQK